MFYICSVFVVSLYSYVVFFGLLCFVETRGGTRKTSINCCSVWAWRKSGIKILGTAGGLLFFTFFHFFKKGSIFATFLVQNKELGQRETFEGPYSPFLDRFHQKSDKSDKKWPRRREITTGTIFWRFLVQNGRFLVRILEKPGSPTFYPGVRFLKSSPLIFINPRL